MEKVQKDIVAFMLAAKQELPEKPVLPDLKTRQFRARLIIEEAMEQCEALGVMVCHNHAMVDMQNLTFMETCRRPDLVEIADSTFDQVYVSVGTAAACGIDIVPIWKIGKKSNMAKFAEGYSIRPDGKILKPPGWIAPTLEFKEEIIRQQEA